MGNVVGSLPTGSLRGRSRIRSSWSRKIFRKILALARVNSPNPNEETLKGILRNNYIRDFPKLGPANPGGRKAYPLVVLL